MDGIIELDPSAICLSAAGPDHIRTPLPDPSRVCLSAVTAVVAAFTLDAACFVSLLFSSIS
jgi:hypothetical protein